MCWKRNHLHGAVGPSSVLSPTPDRWASPREEVTATPRLLFGFPFGARPGNFQLFWLALTRLRPGSEFLALAVAGRWDARSLRILPSPLEPRVAAHGQSLDAHQHAVSGNKHPAQTVPTQHCDYPPSPCDTGAGPDPTVNCSPRSPADDARSLPLLRVSGRTAGASVHLIDGTRQSYFASSGT